MKTLLVVDDKVGDPIADAVLASPVDGIEVTKLSDFFKICDVTISDDGADVGDLELRRPYDRVIDRVVEISPQTISEISGVGSGMQRGQIMAIYDHILSLTDPVADGCQYTTVGKLLPLPSQWGVMARSFPSIRTPTFRYGYGPEPVDWSDMLEPIFKTPFDLYTWKPNKRPDEQPWDEFVVTRPLGVPVLSFMLTDEVVIEALEPMQGEIPHTQLIRSIMPAVLGLFTAKVGEVLWFVSEDGLTFAAFSHFLAGAARSGRFAAQSEAYARRALAGHEAAGGWRSSSIG